ncbi:xanthine dehydrogenase small subunit [Deinococcus aquiradiocola]|uniref:Xanthine dehydrogenase, N-terminal subunit n=1 Tax=Deinococcus aquiradiocola TaxID=393059 RepID=A0A917PCD0_9DEIO|nr:FAD binding domain-containing protein [Deinococcus aquiradiocola]GGJ70793.1 xanthine dehydrogenase, N-terminal subunit [Deinococcus aquiradiocola]
MDVTLTVNGVTRAATGITPHTSLLHWLRREGLTGSKEGCAEGECGACAVLLSRPGEDGGTRLESVNGCLLPLAALNGQEVRTVEGLGTPAALHPVQEALAVRGGSQCGYCTPGFVVSMAAEYYRPEREVTEDGNGFALDAVHGNLCRCTGYRPIRDAAQVLGRPAQADPLLPALQRPAPGPRATRLTADGATFLREETLQDTLRVLQEYPDARVLAGGTDVSVEVNLRHARPPLLLAVDHLPDLTGLHWTPDTLEIGAALPLSDLQRRLSGRVPLLDAWFPLFASRLIRNRATLGGNLGTGSPIGDSPPVLLALDARVVLTSLSGEREVPLSAFFTGYRQTLRRPDELIRAVRVPLPLAPLSGFQKIAKRHLDDISSVAVAFALRVEDGVVRHARIGLGGVAATPLRALITEAALEGQPWTAEVAERAARLLSAEGTPQDDHRASAAYRAAMLGNALRRFHGEHPAPGTEAPV